MSHNYHICTALSVCLADLSDGQPLWDFAQHTKTALNRHKSGLVVAALCCLCTRPPVVDTQYNIYEIQHDDPSKLRAQRTTNHSGLLAEQHHNAFQVLVTMT